MRVPPCCVCSLSCCVRVRCAWCASQRPRARVVLLRPCVAPPVPARERAPREHSHKVRVQRVKLHTVFSTTQLSLWPPTRESETVAETGQTRDCATRTGHTHCARESRAACACPRARTYIRPDSLSSQPSTLLSLVLVNTKPFAHDSRARTTRPGWRRWTRTRRRSARSSRACRRCAGTSSPGRRRARLRP